MERRVFDPGQDQSATLPISTREFAQAVIGPACDVMGHSFGGWTALWLAVKHPRMREQLVLEAPGGLRIGMTASPPPDPAEMQRRALRLSGQGQGSGQATGGRRRQQAGLRRYHAGKIVDETLLARMPEIKTRTLIVLGP